MRTTALVAHALVIALLLWLAHMSVGLLLIVPLLAPLRGMWRGERYTYAWTSMLLLFYCGGFLAEAYMRPSIAWLLRAAAIVVAIEFVSAILFVRLQAREAAARTAA